MAVATRVEYREAAGHKWYAHGVDPRTNLANIPVPGYYGSDRIKGRAGNLVVYQMKSAIGYGDAVHAALRSLGLRGVFSASLRMDHESTWGLIRVVQHLVSVLKLDVVFYKSIPTKHGSPELKYERMSFGSETQPGALYRSASGEYFVFESDRRKLLLNWSTSKGLSEALDNFEVAFGAEFSSSKISILGVTSRDLISDHARIKIFEATAGNLLSEAREMGLASVAFARIAYEGVQLTWRQPYVRFSDRDSKFGELGVLSSDLDLEKAKAFALSTGPQELFADAEVEITVRKRDGRQRTTPF